MNTIRILALLVIGLLCIVTMADASPTARITSGTTKVIFSRAFAQSTNGGSIAVLLTSPAQQKNGFVRFKVESGSVDTASLRGEINHQGGIRFTNGSTVIDLSNLIIDTTGSIPVLTALARTNNSIVGRISLFTFQIVDPIVSRSPRFITISNSPMKLTNEAAYLLNHTFNTNIFNSQAEIGSTETTVRYSYSYSLRGLKAPFNCYN